MSLSFKIDLKGCVFSDWTATEFVPTESRDAVWRCTCSCGTIREVALHNLKSGKSKSCGHVFYSTVADLFPERSKTHIRGRERTPKLDVLYDYYKGARDRGLSWDLIPEEFYFLAESSCHYCGVYDSNNRTGYLYNGVDRIDNLLGYSIGNCVSCCRWCNRAKNTSTVEEFVERCRRVADNWRP